MSDKPSPADLEAMADIKEIAANRRKQEHGTDEAEALAEAASLREQARLLREGNDPSEAV